MGKIASVTIIHGKPKVGRTSVALGLAQTIPKPLVIDCGQFGLPAHQRMLKKGDKPSVAFAIQTAEFFSGANVIVVPSNDDDPFVSAFLNLLPPAGPVRNISIGFTGSTNGEATNPASSIEASSKARQRLGKRSAKAV